MTTTPNRFGATTLTADNALSGRALVIALDLAMQRVEAAALAAGATPAQAEAAAHIALRNHLATVGA